MADGTEELITRPAKPLLWLHFFISFKERLLRYLFGAWKSLCFGEEVSEGKPHEQGEVGEEEDHVPQACNNTNPTPVLFFLLL